jgi:hypothetical protein
MWNPNAGKIMSWKTKANLNEFKQWKWLYLGQIKKMCGYGYGIKVGLVDREFYLIFNFIFLKGST